ncbi:hypothetical protein BGZ47_008781, partial [Haplosporangium gracile]
TFKMERALSGNSKLASVMLRLIEEPTFKGSYEPDVLSPLASDDYFKNWAGFSSATYDSLKGTTSKKIGRKHRHDNDDGIEKPPVTLIKDAYYTADDDGIHLLKTCFFTRLS